MGKSVRRAGSAAHRRWGGTLVSNLGLMPSYGGRRNVPPVSTEPVTTPTLAELSASRAQQATVVRWLQPLAVCVLVVVVWSAFHAQPGPGSLPVAIALAAFVLGGAGTFLRRGAVHVTAVIVLLAASTALMWLQPDGVAIAGIFVALTRLAPMLRGHRSVPLIVVGLASVAVIVASAGHGSVTSALLSAITLGAFYGMFFLAMRLAEANRLAERLVVELQGSRAAQARAAGLAERQRLAREMHDVLAHSLSGLILQLEGARMLAAEDPSDPRLPQVVNRAHQLGRTGLEEARRAIGMLRDDELPGPERLAGLATQFQQDRDVPCELTVSGAPYPLGSEARLAVYRVAQEALTNITKHTHPVRVELRLGYEPSTVRLTVRDFTAAGPALAEPATDGYGLTGMRERAELLGGTLTTSATDRGFRVELAVPR
jgi:signal transduction histidine kinase